jgi:inhibitor of KinA sporulation pathway (predicted exonuclease)
MIIKNAQSKVDVQFSKAQRELEVLNDWTKGEIVQLSTRYQQKHTEPVHERLQKRLQDFLDGKQKVERETIRECIRDAKELKDYIKLVY